MRRRRQRLQVSTFPFLAVLLGAMGSLILVLLVMDRRAKRVAQAKVLQATAQAAAEDERARDARRAEWERRRQELHARLAEEDREVRAQIQGVLAQIEAALADVRDEEERQRRLQEWLRTERAALARLEQEVAAARAQGSQAGGQSRAAQAEAARLAAELERMERTLKQIQEARRRAQRTYSVVPYRGSRGDSRRPIYVECAAEGVIFHPERQAITGPEPSRPEIRAEFERRLAARRPDSADTGAPNDEAYLFLLVRPDGVLSYHSVTEALKGLPLAFGYELIDSDWVLDFPRGEDEPTLQPWRMAAGAGPVLPNATAAAALRDAPRGVTFGTAPFDPNRTGPAGGRPDGGGLASQPPSVMVGGGSVAAARIREGGGQGWGTGSGSGAALVQDQGPGIRIVGRISSPSGPAGRIGNPSYEERSAHPASGPGQDSARHAPATNAPSGSSARTDEAETPSQARAPTSGEQREGSLPGGLRQPGGGSPGGAGDSADRSTPQPRPVRLGGNRDMIIQVECAAGALVLHPSRLRIPTIGLTPARGSDNPLAQAIQQMIARRQAAVRPGELPYRPQVRFLVRPDGLRSFHLAYPALELLHLPMTRQDLGRGDEIPAP